MERRAFWLNTALIAVSLFLTVVAFVGDDLLRALSLDPIMARFVLGMAAVCVLVGSITEFRVNWGAMGGRHSEAASKLSELKAKYRKAYAETNGTDSDTNKNVTVEYERIMNSLPTIPDRWFNALKAEHQFKRLLSQRISQFPKTPIWFLKVQLRMEGIGEAVRHGRKIP